MNFTDSPHVTIALSTHNGAAFLQEQLQSFLHQTHADWSLLWRDDGSSDRTLAVMQDFMAGEGAGRVNDACDSDGQIGVGQSFFRLLRHVPADHYLAFADQDDVWLSRKLERGLAAFARLNSTQPALYCARQFLVNADLKNMHESQTLCEPAGFPQALTQNIATGCTVMLNPAAIHLIAQSRPPSDMLHDWWAYIVVAAAGGRVMIDEVPVVYYRQHGKNAIGVPPSGLRRAVAALRRGPRRFMEILRSNIDALAGQPALLTPENRKILLELQKCLNKSRLRRIKMLATANLRRQRFAETQLFRLWFLLG